VRRLTAALAMLGLCATLLGVAGCGGGSGSANGSEAPKRCPAAWAAGWQRWANRVDARVYCPTFLPNPLTGQIGGQWNTAREPGRSWQLGYAWLEHDDLVHVIFEGYPATAFPPSCEGIPCFAGKRGTETIAGHRVTWYDRNQASHTGHVAAVFRDGPDVYVVSMHVSRPYGTVRKTTQLVRQMVAGLVPVDPRK
jgi:hypothetical protein